MLKEAIEREKQIKLPELLPYDLNDMKNLENEVKNIVVKFPLLCLSCFEQNYSIWMMRVWLFNVSREVRIFLV